MDIGTVVTVVGSILAGGVGLELLKSLTGRGRAKREENRDGWVAHDREASRRREVEEHLYLTRRHAFDFGMSEGPGPKQVPPIPESLRRPLGASASS